MTQSRTLTHYYSLTSTFTNVDGAPTFRGYVTKVYRPSLLSFDYVKEDLIPQLISIPTASSVFVLVGVPMLLIIIVGIAYSCTFTPLEPILDPKEVDPAFFIGTAAAPLRRSKRTRRAMNPQQQPARRPHRRIGARVFPASPSASGDEAPVDAPMDCHPRLPDDPQTLSDLQPLDASPVTSEWHDADQSPIPEGDLPQDDRPEPPTAQERAATSGPAEGDAPPRGGRHRRPHRAAGLFRE
jgi:hypothetical protein